MYSYKVKNGEKLKQPVEKAVFNVSGLYFMKD
jgi:hypothetical protein